MRGFLAFVAKRSESAARRASVIFRNPRNHLKVVKIQRKSLSAPRVTKLRRMVFVVKSRSPSMTATLLNRADIHMSCREIPNTDPSISSSISEKLMVRWRPNSPGASSSRP